MGDKEKRHGINRLPNTARLPNMNTTLLPEGTPVDTNSILRQIKDTLPTLQPRPRKLRH